MLSNPAQSVRNVVVPSGASLTCLDEHSIRKSSRNYFEVISRSPSSMFVHFGIPETPALLCLEVSIE